LHVRILSSSMRIEIKTPEFRSKSIRPTEARSPKPEARSLEPNA
jgi:hypothetical protein